MTLCQQLHFKSLWLLYAWVVCIFFSFCKVGLHELESMSASAKGDYEMERCCGITWCIILARSSATAMSAPYSLKKSKSLRFSEMYITNMTMLTFFFFLFCWHSFFAPVSIPPVLYPSFSLSLPSPFNLSIPLLVLSSPFICSFFQSQLSPSLLLLSVSLSLSLLT